MNDWAGSAQAESAAASSILPMLDDPDPIVRQSAAWNVGRIGPAAKATIPKLESLLLDSNQDVRRAAAEALKKIRGEELPK
jgi:HEAT repeat protein